MPNPIALRMSERMVEIIDWLATREERSRSGQIVHLVRQGLIASGQPTDLDALQTVGDRAPEAPASEEA